MLGAAFFINKLLRALKAKLLHKLQYDWLLTKQCSESGVVLAP